MLFTRLCAKGFVQQPHEVGTVAITLQEMKKMTLQGDNSPWVMQWRSGTGKDSNPDSMTPQTTIITIMPSCFLAAPQMCSLTFAWIAQAVA